MAWKAPEAAEEIDRRVVASPAQVRSLLDAVEAIAPDLTAFYGCLLAARPYDLRHSGVTLQLNAGVPAPEVARRAGHSVAILPRVYAGCIDGHDQIWNSSIDQALTADATA